MEETPGDPRIDALTEDALQLMAESGASGAVLLQFARRFPQMVAARLEPSPPSTSVLVDVESLASLIKETMVSLYGPGGVAPRATGKANPDRRGTSAASRVKINVDLDGKRTSIKIRADIVEKLTALPGGPKARETLQAFVNEAPKDHPNRSAWVEERALQHLIMKEVQATPGLVRH